MTIRRTALGPGLKFFSRSDQGNQAVPCRVRITSLPRRRQVGCQSTGSAYSTLFVIWPLNGFVANVRLPSIAQMLPLDFWEAFAVALKPRARSLLFNLSSTPTAVSLTRRLNSSFQQCGRFPQSGMSIGISRHRYALKINSYSDRRVVRSVVSTLIDDLMHHAADHDTSLVSGRMQDHQPQPSGSCHQPESAH